MTNCAKQWQSHWIQAKLDSLPYRIHHGIVFHAYKALLDPLNLKNPSILEIGCGPGLLTARMMERYGGKATLIDSCKEALELAKDVFKDRGLKAKFVHQDMFSYRFNGRYDIVHSEGLIEHFTDNQKDVLDIHRSCASKEGHVLVCVPRPSWYYKMWKKIWETRRKWHFGYERAIKSKELVKLLEDSGLEVERSFDYFRYAFALCKVK